jgi:hypothetical protein
MHQDQPCAGLRHDGEHLFVGAAETSFTMLAPAARASAATAACRLSMLIGTSGRAARSPSITGKHTAAFLGRGHRLCARPGRLAADVDQIGTVIGEAGRRARRRPASRRTRRRH